jgi:nucleoside-diphosphate-sugar epimerase
VRREIETSRAAAESRLRASYAGRRVLIVGADGFLGVNATLMLRGWGARVALLSRRMTPRAAGSSPVYHGDLRDRDMVARAVAGQDIVFDFAGATGAVDSNNAPLDNLEIEILPHLTLFDACTRARPAPLVVFCSSRLVYGRPQYLPVDEQHPLCPASIYAAHKIAAENYLRVFHQTHQLRYCVVRLSNPYGPYDEPQSKTYGAINHFIRQALERQPIRVYGDGTQLRDYVHVDDALLAFFALAANEACHNDVFNVGGRHPLALREAVATLAEQVTGTRVEYVPWPADAQRVETGDYCTARHKLERALDLPTPYTFADGLRQTLRAIAAQRTMTWTGAPAVARDSAQAV